MKILAAAIAWDKGGAKRGRDEKLKIRRCALTKILDNQR
jgi:hypothetical protein